MKITPQSFFKAHKSFCVFISICVLILGIGAFKIFSSLSTKNTEASLFSASITNTTKYVKGDFNGDSKSDVLWRNKSTGQVYIWLMDGISKGIEGSPATVDDLNWEIKDTGDFNGDLKSDVLWRNKSTGKVYIWIMDGIKKAIKPESTEPYEGSPATVEDLNWEIQGTGDFNGDLKSDVLWRNKLTGQVYIWIMEGISKGIEGSPATVEDLNWEIKATGDFNDDLKYDILWKNSKTGQVYIWIMNGIKKASKSVDLKESYEGSPATVDDLNWEIQSTGDFNGDSKSDVLWKNSKTGQVYVWIMDGIKKASKSVDLKESYEGSPATVEDLNWEIQTTGDFNGDLKYDVLWKNKSTGEVRVWIMNGTEKLSEGSPATVEDLNWGIVVEKKSNISTSLTVSLDSSVSSATKINGSTGVEMLAFNIKAGDLEEVKVTYIKLTGYIDSQSTVNADFGAGSDADTATYYFKDVIKSVKLYKETVAEANKIGDTESANSSGEVTFDNFTLSIAKGETVKLIAVADLSNSSTYGTAQTRVSLDIADVSSDITSQDKDGDDIDEGTTGDNMNGSTSPTVKITISNGGTLAADIPSNTASTQTIVAGIDNNEMSTIKFTASSEPFLISKLILENNYDTTAGEYDDNIETLKVMYYTDAAQKETETKTCTLSAKSGFFSCTGLNMYVPNPDIAGNPDYAYVTVLADLNTMAYSQADAGDKPGFTLACKENFEATGLDSGIKIFQDTLICGNMKTNPMVVQGTKLTIANQMSSKTGAQSPAEEAMKFNITADSSGDANIRQGKTLTTAALGADTDGTIDNNDPKFTIDGASSLWRLSVDAGDSISFDAGSTGVLDDYSRVSFWIYTYDAGSQAVDYANLKISTNKVEGTVGENATVLASSGSIANDTWTLIDMTLPTVDSTHQYFHFELDAVGNLADADFIVIDDLKFYNEKIMVDLSANVNIDVRKTFGDFGTTAYLKQNGSIKATGQTVWYDTTATSYGTLVFVPVGKYGDIEINGTDTFTVEIDTTVFTNASNATEQVTTKVDLGNITTIGDIYWRDIEGSATVNYTGVSAIDKVSTTVSY